MRGLPKKMSKSTAKKKLCGRLCKVKPYWKSVKGKRMRVKGYKRKMGY